VCGCRDPGLWWSFRLRGATLVVWAAVIVHPVYAHFASGIFLLRGTSGVQPRDSEQ
jgi:hypothetical protein